MQERKRNLVRTAVTVWTWPWIPRANRRLGTIKRPGTVLSPLSLQPVLLLHQPLLPRPALLKPNNPDKRKVSHVKFEMLAFIGPCYAITRGSLLEFDKLKCNFFFSIQTWWVETSIDANPWETLPPGPRVHAI